MAHAHGSATANAPHRAVRSGVVRSAAPDGYEVAGALCTEDCPPTFATACRSFWMPTTTMPGSLAKKSRVCHSIRCRWRRYTIVT